MYGLKIILLPSLGTNMSGITTNKAYADIESLYTTKHSLELQARLDTAVTPAQEDSSAS